MSTGADGIESCDVLVVGAGPAGLAAAVRLKQRGVASVVVVERDTQPGGIPRHCLHSPFGMREFHRLMGGPAYARALARAAVKAGAELRLATSVVAVERGEGLQGNGLLVTVTSDAGVARLAPSRLLLATGARETPRAARLVSGDRPLGVMNTGALQLYAERGLAPFRRPVVVGTELVALSALLTCRALGIRPVAMIEPAPVPTARAPFLLLPRLLGVPVRYGTDLAGIEGGTRVEAVRLARPGGGEEAVACDGVVLTGRFRPESSLARSAGLDIDPGTGGPSIDQFARTSDPRIFAAGNLLRPIETAGWCWSEGRAVADFVLRSLNGGLPAPQDAVTVQRGAELAYVVPQRLAGAEPGLGRLQLRVAVPVRGRLVATASPASGSEGKTMSRRATLRPERRLALPIPEAGTGVTVAVED